MLHVPVVNWLVKAAIYLLRKDASCPRLQPFAPPDSRDCACPTCTLIREGDEFR